MPFRLGQRSVGRQCCRINPIGMVDQGSRSNRQAVPHTVRIAQCRRDPTIQNGRAQRLQQATLGGLPQVSGIDGDQHIGRGAFALGRKTLDQRAGIVADEFDRDAGIGLETLEQRLDQVRLTRGVDHDPGRG